jgi:polar amino acid transport system substrate-binding protein
MTALRIGAAYPDPPFNGVGDSGLDIDLMHAVAEKLGLTAEFIGYGGADFNGIFDELAAGGFDVVTSGTTVTPERARTASFCPPYLVSGQSMAVDVRRHPAVTTTADLTGLIIGVQQGNTSEPVARHLVDAGAAASVRVYDYGEIATAISDLTNGGCDAFMKLAPVLTALVADVDGVEVVQRGITREEIAIAVRLDDTHRMRAVSAAQAELEADGSLARLRARWLGNPVLDQNAG